MRGAINRKFLENISNTKTTVRKNTMRQDNFRKCSRCHRFNEIF